MKRTRMSAKCSKLKNARAGSVAEWLVVPDLKSGDDDDDDALFQLGLMRLIRPLANTC